MANPLLAALLIGCASAAPYANANAQTTVAPALRAHVRTVEEIAPKGYRIIARAEGDLDGDGLVDAVVVIARDDAVLQYEEARPLVVLRRDARGYRVVGRSDTVVLTAPPGAHGDALDGIAIRERTIEVSTTSVGHAQSSGGTSTELLRYRRGAVYHTGTESYLWSYPDPGQDAAARINDYLCPELKLAAAEVCAELETSADCDARRLTLRWSIYRAGEAIPGDRFRTHVERCRLDPPVWRSSLEQPH